MGANTKIEWCDHTFNPWTGCTKVSEGCANCYAEAWSKRSGLVKWGDNGTRRLASAAKWREPLKWNRDAEKAGERRKVFCASLADVFEDRDELDRWRLELMQLIYATPALDWLLLTKRPEFAVEFFTHQNAPGNVWLGTSIENQHTANERIPQLLKVDVAVRFLSIEPLLGPIVLPSFATRDDKCDVDWIIVGGESGYRARPFFVEWARSLKAQCGERTAFFMKQLGANPHSWDELLDLQLAECVLESKGGRWDEWPSDLHDLKVREFPNVKDEVPENCVRLACRCCDREDHDGITSTHLAILEATWHRVTEFQSWKDSVTIWTDEQCLKEGKSNFEWFTHLGLCPECQLAEAILNP